MTRCKQSNRTAHVRTCCQVCQLDMSDMQVKDYFKIKKACPQHVAADAVHIPGKASLHRWCHQCGKFEPLSLFDGARRSCRNRLVKRRKPAADSQAAAASDTSSADSGRSTSPGSQDTQRNNCAAQLTATAADSPAWGFLGPAMDATGCSMPAGASDDLADGDIDAQLQQLLQEQLASCAVPCNTGLPACQVPMQQQQQGFMGMVPAAVDAAARSPAAATDDFDDMLATMMQDELLQCLQEQQQQQAVQAQHHSMGLQGLPAPGSGYTTPAPLSPSYQGAMGQQHGSSAAVSVATACVPAPAPMVAAAAMDAEPWADNSSASSTLPVLEAFPGFPGPQGAAVPAAAPSAGGAGCMASAADELRRLQRMQQLREELELLERSTAATASSINTLPACGAAMPAHMAAAPQLGNHAHAAGAAASMLHPSQLARQQQALAVNQRLQQLHNQVVEVSAQLNQLRGMVYQAQPASVAASMCFGPVGF